MVTTGGAAAAHGDGAATWQLDAAALVNVVITIVNQNWMAFDLLFGSDLTTITFSVQRREKRKSCPQGHAAQGRGSECTKVQCAEPHTEGAGVGARVGMKM